MTQFNLYYIALNSSAMNDEIAVVAESYDEALIVWHKHIDIASNIMSVGRIHKFKEVSVEGPARILFWGKATEYLPDDELENLKDRVQAFT